MYNNIIAAKFEPEKLLHAVAKLNTNPFGVEKWKQVCDGASISSISKHLDLQFVVSIPLFFFLSSSSNTRHRDCFLDGISFLSPAERFGKQKDNQNHH